ncbi:MAG: hypothetical protein ACLFP8_02715 [Alphaproteobacteria bacterium]
MSKHGYKNGSYLKRRRYSLAVIMVVAFSSAPALADKGELGLSITQNALWDSNPLMLSSNESSIVGSETQATFDYTKKTPNTVFQSGLTATRNQFSDSRFSSSDFLGFSGLNVDAQRWGISVQANIKNDTTRTSEVTTFGLDVGSSGRQSYSITPSVSYDISPRNAIMVSGKWEKVRYEDTAFTDYRTYAIIPSIVHNLSPRQQVQLSWLYNRYESDSADQHVETSGPSVSWKYAFRPYLSLNISGSLLKTTYHGYGNADNQDERMPAFAVTLDYSARDHALKVHVEKARQAYANGTESYITTYALSDRYSLNQNTSLAFSAQYQDARHPPISGSTLDNSWSVSGSVDYALAKDWNLAASYRHKQERLVNNSKVARQDIYKMGVTHQF